MKAKNQYLVDAQNRLMIKLRQKTLSPDGRFNIDKDNRLHYWLNAPAAWRREYGLPGKIRFRGNWRLTADHELELILDKTAGQSAGECLVFKGEIIAVDRDGLAFEVKSRDARGQSHFQILNYPDGGRQTSTIASVLRSKERPPRISWC